MKMRKQLFGVLLALLLCVTMAVPAFASSNMPRLVDNARLLTGSEQSELLDKLDEISQRQQVDIVVVTTDALNGKTPEAYADDFYDNNGYGFGKACDGVLLLVSTEDWDWHLSTCGYGMTAITDDGIEYISNQFLPDLSDGDYMAAFAAYADLCDEFITQAKTGQPYDGGHMAFVKSVGVQMYMELNADGTGALFMEDEMPLTWADGAISFTEENMTVSYTLENGEMKLDMIETVLVLRKGEKPEPVASEMEQAGFTYFMEEGEPYAFVNWCADNEELETFGEATVVSYEIFESADGYEPLEGYEWRTATIEIRFFDDNAWEYGVEGIFMSFEDYYNTKLLDDTAELVEETDTYSQYQYTVIHNGQEMDAYYFDQAGTWSDWYENEDGNHECKFTTVEEFLVPVGYDGCVVSMANSRLEWPDGSYITALDPDEFLLFRLN